MPRRAKYGTQILQETHKTLPLEGIWQKVLGTPAECGFWIVYGREKNGKTWHSLKLAEMLSEHKKVMYVNAEQGLGASFQEAYNRIGLDPKNKKLQFYDYLELEDLEQLLDKKRSPQVVFIDNTTIYADEINKTEVKRLALKYRKKLFVWVAHEERNEPAGALARLIKKLAEVIVKVEGLAAIYAGRVPGGMLSISEEQAELYHGTGVGG